MGIKTIIITLLIWMSYGLKYQMSFKNAEDQLIEVNIHDKLYAGPNPYNISYVKLGALSYKFSWNPLPADATGVQIVATHTVTLAETVFDREVTSPAFIATILLPGGPYRFNVIIQRPGGDEEYDPDNLPQAIELQPADDAYTLSSVDNDEDKFKVVRAKKAVFRFLSNQSITLDNFIRENVYDDRYLVIVKKNSREHFRGFLNLDDMNEPYLSPRNVVVLTAIDKLGSLKEETLVGFDGLNPRGMNSIAKYVAMALRRTGHNLPINVVMNIKRAADAPLVSDAGFSNSLGAMIVPYSDFWTTGKKVRITGSDDNDGVITVTGVAPLAFGLLIVGVAEPLVDENASGVLFETAVGGGHFFNSCYLDAKTFEADINVSVDCYRVLEMILGELCYITMEKGQWWIWRVDELEAADNLLTVFDSEGNWIEDKVIDLKKEIGNGKDIWPSNNATIVESNRALKYIKEKFNFSDPKELVCNINFERGEFIEDLPDEEGDNGNIEQVKSFTLECWDFLSKEGGGARNDLEHYDQPPIANSAAYIKKNYYNGRIVNTELVIETPSPSGQGVPYVKSSRIYVNKYDKINLSISLYYTNYGSATVYVNSPVMVVLFGNNGTVWQWRAYHILDPNAKGVWVETGMDGLVEHWHLGAAVSDPATTLSHESPPIPTEGYIQVYLLNQYAAEIKAHFSALRINLIQFINGAYTNYAGYYYQVSQPVTTDGEYKANREREVYIGEAPRKSFKGALHYYNGTTHELATGFYDANKNRGIITDDMIRPFGYLQALDVFNQYNRTIRTIRLNAQGLSEDAVDADDNDDTPGLVHRYVLTDNSPHANNKIYMLMGFDQNMKRCGWRGVLKEVLDTTIEKVDEVVTGGYVEA